MTWRQQIDNQHLVHAAIVERYPNGSTDLEAHLDPITDPKSGKKVGKLTPAAARSWQAMAAHALRDGVLLLPTSPADSFRPLAVQQRLFGERYTTSDQGNGSRVCSGKRWWKRKGVATAACPGTSNHGTGEAVDVSDASGPRLAWLEAHARTYGWAWELDSEPWHVHYLLGDALPPGLDEEVDAMTPDQWKELVGDRIDGEIIPDLRNITKALGGLVVAVQDPTSGLGARLAGLAADVEKAIDDLDDSKPGGLTKGDVKAALAEVLSSVKG